MTSHDDVRCRKFGDGLSDLANSTSSVIGKMAGLGVGRLSDVAIVLIACAITMCCGLFFLRILTFWAKAGVLFSVVLAVVPVVVVVVLFGIALSDIRGMGFAVESELGMVYGWAAFGSAIFALAALAVALIANFSCVTVHAAGTVPACACANYRTPQARGRDRITKTSP